MVLYRILKRAVALQSVSSLFFNLPTPADHDLVSFLKIETPYGACDLCCRWKCQLSWTTRVQPVKSNGSSPSVNCRSACWTCWSNSSLKLIVWPNPFDFAGTEIGVYCCCCFRWSTFLLAARGSVFGPSLGFCLLRVCKNNSTCSLIVSKHLAKRVCCWCPFILWLLPFSFYGDRKSAR